MAKRIRVPIPKDIYHFMHLASLFYPDWLVINIIMSLTDYAEYVEIRNQLSVLSGNTSVTDYLISFKIYKKPFNEINWEVI